MNRILIAEDESRIASFIEKGLRAAGFATIVVDDGPSALALARDGAFDLMVLDLGLPGLDGVEVLSELRARGENLPVIVLTARSTTADTIAGLESGADDYMTKPFAFDELLARIRVRLRDPGTAERFVLDVGGVELDVRTRTATVDGASIELSAREYGLLELLMRHPGQVLSRQQLLSSVWGYDFDTSSNVVDVYVGYLRKKLGGERIATVRGVGYRFSA